MEPGLSVYFIFNIFLLIMSGYLFLKTTPDLMKKQEKWVFKAFIVAFWIYIIFNSFWTMQEYDIIQMPKWLFKTICAASLGGVMLNTYCFYKFLMNYFGYSKKENMHYILFGASPFLVVLTLLIISIWNGLIFSVSDELNIIHGKGYIILPICALIYFGIIIVFSSIEVVKNKSPQAKKNGLTMVALTIFLMAWTFIDNLIESLTIIPIVIFAVIIVIFTTFQQASINTDALTQMNNRRKAMEYLSSQLDLVSNDAPLIIYICDINHFKAINDTYGHLEGDNAIIILSNAIKEIVAQTHSFAARYGGDEFIIATKSQKMMQEEDRIIEKVNELVKTKCISLSKPYEITITAGKVVCKDKGVAIETYLKEADYLLYENKKNRPPFQK